MARRVSNVELPEEVVRIDTGSGETFELDVPLPEVPSKLDVPGGEDAIHGAMTMAVWAIPRIDPWLDVLTASLVSDRTRLPELAAKVEARWWRFPPWMRPSDDLRPLDLHDPRLNDCLWLASVDVFRRRATENRVGPREFAEQIADAASRFDRAAKFDEEISAWLRGHLQHSACGIGHSTRRMAGLSGGNCDTIAVDPAGADRLQDVVQRSPRSASAIGWSAATLCGLLHGYRRLDTQFRGKAIQRELLSIHALRTCAAEVQKIDWPACTAEGPRWHKDAGAFVLSWGNREFARKPIKERGRWFAADFEDARIVREARQLSKKSGWSCTYRILGLRDVETPVSGSGNVRVLTEPSPPDRR